LIEKLYEYGDLVAYRPVTDGNDAKWIPFSGNGKIEVRYSNGNVAFLEEYKNGVLHGNDRLYYPDGKVYTETVYDRGDLAGESRTYYADGKLRARGSYKDDERHGTFEHYAADGTLEVEETYEQGYQNGKSILYKKGVKYQEINFCYGIAED
jgi:antitoxin component YwqK of YwqJK toxin-antitoxin module